MTVRQGAPDHFIVIVPGLLGSKLQVKQTKEYVWGSLKIPRVSGVWLEDTLAMLRYPNDNLEPAGIMTEAAIGLPWVKLEQYSHLIKSLESWGYRATLRPGEDESARSIYTFAYDWRQDNRESARQLATALEQWQDVYQNGKPAWIIAHCNGGLVARWYIERLGGKDRVGKLMLLAMPWAGAPKAMCMLEHGFDLFLRRWWPNRVGIPLDIGQLTRPVLRSFPSLYQLLPFEEPFLRGADNENVDIFDMQWLDGSQQLSYLRDGKTFYDELGCTSSVETAAIFGTDLRTTSHGVAHLGYHGQLLNISWQLLRLGDKTVTKHSATPPHWLPINPYPTRKAQHGDIYKDRNVLEVLNFELIGKYRGAHQPPELPASAAKELDVFHNIKDAYAPGETAKFGIHLVDELPDEDEPPEDLPPDASPAWPKGKSPSDGGASGGPDAPRDATPSGSPPEKGTPPDAAQSNSDPAVAILLEWCNPLPGAEWLPHPHGLPYVVLQKEEGVSGPDEALIGTMSPGTYHASYHGNLVIPVTEGYYRVCVVSPTEDGEPEPLHEELIAVQFAPIVTSDSSEELEQRTTARALAAVSRAQAIAETLTSPAERITVLSEVARVYLMLQQTRWHDNVEGMDGAALAAALAATEEIELADRAQMSVALSVTAQALAEFDRAEHASEIVAQARAVAESLEDESQRQVALASVAVVLAQLDRIPEAMELVAEMTDLTLRTATLGDIATVLARAHNMSAANEAATAAYEIARIIVDREESAIALGRAGVALARAGLYSPAVVAADEALDTVSLRGPESDASGLSIATQVRVLSVVAQALALTYARDRAATLMDRVWDLLPSIENERSASIGALALALSTSERPEYTDMALAAAETIEDNSQKALTLVELALSLCQMALASPVGAI